MVGGDLQRSHPLGLHVPQEVHEVAAVGLDRVVREQRVADPGHQGPGRGRGSLPVAAKAWARKASTLAGRRGVAFQEVAPLGQERGAGWRGSASVRRDGREIDACVACESIVTTRCWTKARNIKQIMSHPQRGLQGAKMTPAGGYVESWQGVRRRGRAGDSV